MSTVLRPSWASEKVAFIKNRFGFDEAINYRTTADTPAAIADAVLARLNPYGRVAACGMIANYNDSEQGLSPSIPPLVLLASGASLTQSERARKIVACN